MIGGAFEIQAGRTRLVRPNTFHSEGSLRLWQAAFPGSLEPAFSIGISGINLPDDWDRRPDHIKKFNGPYTSPDYLGLDVETTFADLCELLSHDGGVGDWHGDGVHARLMEYTRKAATLSVVEQSGGVRVSAGATFANALPWQPKGNPEDLADPGYWLHDYWAAGAAEGPNHDYPWDIPYRYPGWLDTEDYGIAEKSVDGQLRVVLTDTTKTWTPGGWIGHKCWVHGIEAGIVANTATEITLDTTEFDDHGETSHAYTIRTANVTAIEIEEELWRGSSLPLRCAYLIEGVASPALVASCVFAADVVLPPASGLTVAWSGRMRNYREAIDG